MDINGSTSSNPLRRPRTPGMSTIDARPPAKRARKAINCEPCRSSKLKCDRQRPCSSCVLRDTTDQCFPPNADGTPDPRLSQSRGDDDSHNRVDPAQEIAKLRQSLNRLEAHIFTRPHHPPPPTTSGLTLSSAADYTRGGRDPTAILGNQSGGLYAGPTSAASWIADAPDSHDRVDSSAKETGTFSHDYDLDLIDLLPPIATIDALIAFYFDYANWIFHYIDQPSFISAWTRFKNGSYPDRIILATACIVMAVALQYLPANDSICASLGPETNEELGDKYYDVMRRALHRQDNDMDSGTYTVELIELLLTRCHYHQLAKRNSEEVWRVRGNIVSFALAMGLHRDPQRWNIPKDVAERRRWAWWNALLVERWQCFLFGRPTSIASHHFDTQLPSEKANESDSSGAHLPHISLFRLNDILGDIVDDAVSVRSVPYESVLGHDRALTSWYSTLPAELDLNRDDYSISTSLASPVLAERRSTIQSLIIRVTYYSIRFTLHRPYTVSYANASPRRKESVEAAVAAADKVISSVTQSRPHLLANQSLAVPGLLNWGVFHAFSAAMFFAFQLVSDPNQNGASLFRANIQKAMTMLEQAKDGDLGRKSYDILRAMAPLYSAEFPIESLHKRERTKASVLSIVRTLQFPYHDSPKYPRRSAAATNSPHSTNTMNSDSPAFSVFGALSSPGSRAESAQSNNIMHPVSSLRDTSAHDIPPTMNQSMSIAALISQNDETRCSRLTQNYDPSLQLSPSPSFQQFDLFAPAPHAAEQTAWGPLSGFLPGEWTGFLEAIQPPSSSGFNR